MWKLEQQHIRTVNVVIQTELYITVNGTQASKLQKYCLEHFIAVNYSVYKEIRS